MRLKKCENCMHIAEFVNGTCMKCGFKEGHVPTYERQYMEQIEKIQAMEQGGIVKKQGEEASIYERQRAEQGSLTRQFEIGNIWYTLSFWLPFLGFIFAAALLCSGEIRIAEALLRNAIVGWVIASVIIILVLIIVLGNIFVEFL